MICVTLSLLIHTIYSGGVGWGGLVCVLCGSGMLEMFGRLIYISLQSEYVSFPIGKGGIFAFVCL